MVNIITMCSAGLVRSVSLADVLKLHFEPANQPGAYPDVVPVGIDKNSGVLDLLFPWADHIVVMEGKYAKRIPEQWQSKVMVCEVGPDVYGSSKKPELIGQVWRWARANSAALGIQEHNRIV